MSKLSKTLVVCAFAALCMSAAARADDDGGYTNNPSDYAPAPDSNYSWVNTSTGDVVGTESNSVPDYTSSWQQVPNGQ